MKMFHASLALLFATRCSTQGVYSQLGEGFSTKVEAAAPVQVDSSAQPSALSLFLQQAPLVEPSFPVAPPAGLSPPPLGPTVVGNSAMFEAAPGLSAVAAPAPAIAVAVSATGGNLRKAAKGRVTLRSMKVANPGPEGSKVFFGEGLEFAMGTDSAGNFMVQQASATSPLLSVDSANTLHLGSQSVEVKALNAQDGISVRGVKQWQLVQSEDFSVKGAGWSRTDVSQCAGVHMLGGFCKFSKGDVNKTFTSLPPHKQLRVVATYHFIDRWIGETGIMKLNVGSKDCSVVVWSERHAQQEAKNGLSLCGSAETPEGKFSAPIDVTVPHFKDTVTVTFGSTMDDADPCDESWGISSMEVYVRN